MLEIIKPPLGVLALLLCLTFPIASAASEFCSSLAELHKRANYCEDNYEYVNKGKECLEGYRTFVKNRNAEIRKILEGNLAKAAGQAQNQQFDTTKTVYTSADAMLSELIALGHQVHAELHAYELDFVPSETPWSRPRSPFDMVHDPKYRAEFLELEYCYAAPMVEVDTTLAEVDAMVQELVATRTDTMGLHKNTAGRDNRLDDLAQNRPLGGISGKKFRHAKNGLSDITGFAQDEAKAKGVVAAAEATPNFEKQTAGRGISSLALATEAGDKPGLAAGAPAAPGAHSPETSVAAPAKTKTASQEPLGDLVKELKKTVSIEEGREKNSDQSTLENSAKAGSVVTPISQADLRQIVIDVPLAILAPATELTQASDSMEIAGADFSLFELVHRHYRHSKLFR